MGFFVYDVWYVLKKWISVYVMTEFPREFVISFWTNWQIIWELVQIWFWVVFCLIL